MSGVHFHKLVDYADVVGWRPVARTNFAAAEAEAEAAEAPLPPPPPTLKCLNTCTTAGDEICQSGGWGPSGVWRELGTDCTYTTSCDNPLSAHFGADFLFQLRGRAWTVTEGCKCLLWTSSAGCVNRNPAEECGSTRVPATAYTFSFPVAGTIDMATSISQGHGRPFGPRRGPDCSPTCSALHPTAG